MLKLPEYAWQCYCYITKTKNLNETAHDMGDTVQHLIGVIDNE